MSESWLLFDLAIREHDAALAKVLLSQDSTRGQIHVMQIPKEVEAVLIAHPEMDLSDAYRKAGYQ